MKKLILLFASAVFSLPLFCQPDLIITDVGFVQQTNTSIGQTIQVKVVIKNIGNSNYAGEITTGLEWLYDDEGLYRPNVELGGDDASWIGNSSINNLNVGLSKNLYFDYIIAWDVSDTYLHAFIDHSELINETNENNNDFVSYGYPSQPFGLWSTIHNNRSSSVPTLSQWAIIVLGLILLSIASLYIYRKRKVSMQ